MSLVVTRGGMCSRSGCAVQASCVPEAQPSFSGGLPCAPHSVLLVSLGFGNWQLCLSELWGLLVSSSLGCGHALGAGSWKSLTCSVLLCCSCGAGETASEEKGCHVRCRLGDCECAFVLVNGHCEERQFFQFPFYTKATFHRAHPEPTAALPMHWQGQWECSLLCRPPTQLPCCWVGEEPWAHPQEDLFVCQ